MQHTVNNSFICALSQFFHAAHRIIIYAVLAALPLLTLVVAQAYAAAEVEVPETYGDAVRWYHKAAKNGDPEAQFLLAIKYETGTDVLRNKAKALTWFKRAAEQGHVEAQFKLALFYSEAGSEFRDLPKAVRWTEASARNGYGPAQYNLGVAHLNGAGFTADPIQALAWFDLASRGGVEGASAFRRRLLTKLTQEQVETALKLADQLETEITNSG